MIDQEISLHFGVANVSFNRETILALYEYSLWTFSAVGKATSASNSQQSLQSNIGSKDVLVTPALVPNVISSNLKISFVLDSIQLAMNDSGKALAKAFVGKCEASLFFSELNTMKISINLGKIKLDDCVQRKPNQIHRNLIVMEGEQTLSLSYETFANMREKSLEYTGCLNIKAGSLQVTFLEDFANELGAFLSKFFHMQQLVDEAQRIAMQQAESLRKTLLQIIISLKSPIILIPKSLTATELLKVKLGNIDLHNKFSYSGSGPHITTLFTVQFRSIGIRRLSLPALESSILKDVDALLSLSIQTDDDVAVNPNVEIEISISDVQIKASFTDYVLILDTYYTIVNSSFISGGENQDTSEQNYLGKQIGGVTNFASSKKLWDVSIQLPRFGLEIVQESKENSDESLGRLTLLDIECRMSGCVDGGLFNEILLGDFSATDSRLSSTIFYREVIPTVGIEKKRLVMDYSILSDKVSTLIMTIESPKILLIPDFLFTVRDYFLLGYNASSLSTPLELPAQSPEAIVEEETTLSGSFSFRFNVIDAEITILKNNEVEETEAILLYVDQFVLASESILSLAVSRLGVALFNMGRRDGTLLHLIQPIDFTFVMDTRDMEQKQVSISVDFSDLIMLKISYHDVLVVLDILNRITELNNKSNSVVPFAKILAAPNLQNVPKKSDLKQVVYEVVGYVVKHLS